MAASHGSILYQLLFYAFGLFNWCLYLSIAIYNGSFFRKDSEQDQLQLAIGKHFLELELIRDLADILLARDKYWNLSKTVCGLSHRFFILRDGRQLHYLTNTADADPSRSVKPLVILIHGFPDSCIMWRHLLDSTSSLGEKAVLVAVDLPGYGGSDGCNPYSPDEVLEALTEFIVAMRELHMERQDCGNLDGHADKLAHGRPQLYIVGHDWGCALGFRLAAEAPALADRFILTNGPLVSWNDPTPLFRPVIMLYDAMVLTSLSVGAPSYGQQRQYSGLIKADLQNLCPSSHGTPLLLPEVF
jgi:hypothetical protein